MTAKILNFGSLNIDYVYQVDDFVTPGETKLSENLNIFIGGKGNNQSIALARAGANVYHAGMIGDDGLFLVSNLQKEGVNTDFIKVNHKIKTGHAIIQVNEHGENCILLYGGANQAIQSEYFDHVLANFNHGDILLIQNEISNLQDLITKAVHKRMVIYFNPAPMNKNVLNYPLNQIDTLIVNQSEAQAITQDSNPDTAIEKMAALFTKSKIILTLGKNGVVYYYNKQIIKQAAYTTNTVDTTAAGDTFIGYFISGLQKKLSPKESLDLACYASSISVTRHGAADSIPFLRELNLKYDII